MDISIAMCTYNGEKFLDQQLSSIGQQTKLPFEVVICDDGSTDTTVQLLQQFAASAPFPVVIVANQATLGSTRNFDQAICLCRGQVIALCDQDDVWAPNKLERMEQVLETEPGAGGIFSDALLVNDESAVLPKSLWQRRKYTSGRQAELRRTAAAQLLKYNPATGATFAFRSAFVSQITPIPEEWTHDAWIALLIATQAPLRSIPEKLISYRLHAAQQIGIKRLKPSDDLLIKRWTEVRARLATLSVDPKIMRLVEKRLHFLKTRRRLKQQSLARRVIASSGILPGYFHFARGLFSYALDVTGAHRSRVKP